VKKCKNKENIETIDYINNIEIIDYIKNIEIYRKTIKNKLYIPIDFNVASTCILILKGG
jgi:hypothetical protein